MKNRFLAALSGACLIVGFSAGAASAADLPNKLPQLPLAVPSIGAPVFAGAQWTGFYAGLNVGAGFAGRSANGWGYGDDASTSNFGDSVSGYLGGGKSDAGVLGGVTLGYNYQMGRFVVSGEGDFNGSSYKDGASLPASWTVYAGAGGPGAGAGPVGHFTAIHGSSDLPWFGTVRGRFGVDYDRALVYATGGFAFAEVNNSIGPFSRSQVRPGWTVGGGVEYKLWSNWSVKAEYLYADFGKSSVSGIGGYGELAGDPNPGDLLTGGAGASVNNTLNIVRFGVNYKFF